jgi:hypothetical protein
VSEANNGRNPTKKRGRPKKEFSVRKYMTRQMGSRNQGDMIASTCRGLAEDLREELLPQADQGGKINLTMLAYLARFPHEEQREMLELFKALGARGAKRYVECLTRPPSPEEMAKRILRWVTREFPSVPPEDLTRALELVTIVAKDELAGQEPPKRGKRK